MGTTYEYTYEYEVTDSSKHNRNAANTGSHTQRTGGHQSTYAPSHASLNRPGGMDPLVNLQKDRIWHKLYDPPNSDKSPQETEAQVSRTQTNAFIFQLDKILMTEEFFSSSSSMTSRAI